MLPKASAKQPSSLSSTSWSAIAATAIGAFALSNASSAAAEVSECSRLIELSKLRNETVTDSQSFEQYQRDFCNDYQSYKSSGKAMKAGGSYGPISADFGQSSSSVDSVASRYCESNGSVKSTADAYRQYVESIAPGAFESYNNCIQLGNNNIKFTLPPTAIQPTYATFIVSNTAPNTSAFEKIRYRAAPGISCQWDTPAPADGLKLEGRSAATLNCARASANQAGYVVMYAATLPNSAVTVPWEQYVDGAPMSIVTQLRAATADMNAIANSLRGAVIPFHTATCPVGWAEYPEAYGRFIRGIDRGQVRQDPDGTRVVGSIQSDGFASHDHGRPNDVYDRGHTGSVPNGNYYAYGHAAGGPRTDKTGITETRPKNVALLYCRRP